MVFSMIVIRIVIKIFSVSWHSLWGVPYITIGFKAILHFPFVICHL
jgi:hypothetical protein